MAVKSVKIKIRKTLFFIISQRSFNPKIRFLGQKVCSVARVQTDHFKPDLVPHINSFHP